MARRAWLLALIAALLCAAIVPSARAEVADEDDEYEDAVRAHLVIRKSVVLKKSDEPLVVQGTNVTVVLDIFNAGTATASDVSVDDSLPDGAEVIEGSLKGTILKIAPGSSAKLSYVAKFSKGNVGMLLPTARIFYKADDSSTVQLGLSSTPELYVLTPQQQIQRWALIAGSYATLGVARSTTDWRNIAIVVTLLTVLIGGNSAFKSYNTRSATVKRKKALQELEKSD